jgi:hypothetical protein
MRIVINRTFNETFLNEYLNTIMQPNSNIFAANQFIVYDDLSTNYVTKEGVFPGVLFVPATLLEIIDSLNLAEYNQTLDLSGADLAILLNTLYNGGSNERNSALDYLQTNGLITAEQNADARNMTASLLAFDRTNFTRSYDEIEDVYKYSFETPVELSVPYDEVNNPRNNKLYLFFPSQINLEYGNMLAVAGSNGTYSPLQKFYNPVLDKEVAQASYIATELGDITSETADVKYDHMDKIEYIDSFRLRFRLPRVIQ